MPVGVRSGLGNPFGYDCAAKDRYKYGADKILHEEYFTIGQPNTAMRPLEIAKHHRVNDQSDQRETHEQCCKAEDLEAGLQLARIGIYQELF